MAVRLGGGEYIFEVHENWAKVPDEIVLGELGRRDPSDLGAIDRERDSAVREAQVEVNGDAPIGVDVR